MAKAENNLPKPGGKLTPKIIAMALIGAGLLIVGGVVFMLLPRAAVNAETSGDYQSAVPVAVDFPAPDLNLSDMQGNPVSLTDYQGEVVLVNNWAFWCPPCRDELPALQKYYDAHGKQGFTLIGIEAGDELEDVEYHVKLYKMTYPVWLDPHSEATRAFSNDNLPSSYVIDRNGQVVLAWNGPIKLDMLEKYVTPLLEK